MIPAVSIIVPVYNAKQTIRRCIESVINQEFQDWELILIDDGSKDESGQICDEYATQDSRIQVIHKPNTGVSDSRNMALGKARGIYIQFMDSDDWITTDATKLLYRAATDNHCDMVISDFYRVVGKRVSQKGDIDDDVILTREEFAEHMMENPADFYYGVLWNKLFRRDMIEEFGLRMDIDISWCEDFMFNLEYIRHAKTFYALHVPIYYYVKTKGSLASQGMSLTKTIHMKRLVFSYYHNFYKSVFTEEDYEKNRLQVYKFLLDSASDGMVAPTFLLGSRKLGEERTSAVKVDIEGEGILMDEYRDRKLLDRYLEQVALQNDLKLQDIRLLMYLTQPHHVTSYKDLMDFTNMTKRNLMSSLQQLVSKGFIKIEGRTNITLLASARVALQGLSRAQNEYEQARYAGFSDDELVQYAYLSNKIKTNIQKIIN